jgi:hypothetical protein
MKNDYDRNWLENYKVIPKTDNAIYKNYQNPAMNSWDRQMASLSPAQKNRYNQFLNTIPSELQGLSAANMQKYLQDVDEKQNALAHERAGYESQIKKIQNDEAQRNAQWLAQRQAQRQAQQDRNRIAEMNTWRLNPYAWTNTAIMRFRHAGPHLEYLMSTGLPFNQAFEKLMQDNFYAGHSGSYLNNSGGRGWPQESLSHFLRTYGHEGFKFLRGHVSF